jgi:exopolysaccharide biosynthesis polyprenyl glycosylphosphotransferase
MESGTSRQRAAIPQAQRLPRVRPVPPTGLDERTVLATAYGHRDFWTRRALAAADIAALIVAVLVSQLIDNGGTLGDDLAWGALAIPLWVVLFKVYGLYDRDAKRVNHGTIDDVPRAFHAVLVGTLLLWLHFKFVAGEHLTLAQSVTLAVTALAGVLVLRSVVRNVVTRALDGERVLLVGGGPRLAMLVRKMRAHPEYGLDPVGVLATSAVDTGDLPILGTLDDLPRAAIEERIERIVVSPEDLSEDDQLDLLHRSRRLSLKVSLLPQMFDALGPSVEIDDVEGVTVLGMNPPVLSPSSRFMKRALDIAGSALLLFVTAPLFIVIAIAVRLDSRGPVFFHQRRVGRDGRPFRLLKFRTMCADAEERVEELRKFSKDPHWLHLEHDPRLTRVGRVLRHLSLDELPQLLNVLRGEMSLVGPRPLVESEDRRVGGWARSRLDLTPGITGSWQVLGRTSIPFEEMVKLDYLYVTNWSLWTDVRLIMRTLPVVISRRGAN